MGGVAAKFGLILAVLLAYFLGRNFLTSVPKVQIDDDGWFGTGSKRAESNAIEPFNVAVPEEILKDLKDRLNQSRIGHEVLEDSPNFYYGFNVDYLRTVVDYWKTKYDWRKYETIINGFPQFTTQFEGLKIHFIHSKAAKSYKKVFPVLIVHGWPGNVFEFYKIIPILNDPKAHGINVDYAFDVVAPSIPGYGWSESPKRTGFSQVIAARIFRKLMLRLKYEKFFLQGGDWGSFITRALTKLYPENVLGLHINLLGSISTNLSPRWIWYNVIGSWVPSFIFADKQDQSYNFLGSLIDYIKESGYMHIQATKPDTVGTALNDSPLGLAAYILEKFSTWTNFDYRELPDGGLTRKYTLDEVLTIVTIYWVNGNIVASQRFYREFFLDERNKLLAAQFVPVPVAHAHFLNEFFDKQPPELSAQGLSLTYRSHLPNGGHFAAFEEPLALATDFFTFISTLI